MPMVTKLSIVLTYHQGVLPIKSHDPLIMLPCEIMWLTKNTIFPIPECL